ncbi:MAG: glutamine amidotransferase, partial [Acinetobacter sp.]|nr:glutamine amidotransferase [Acinetobacter sp.]
IPQLRQANLDYAQQLESKCRAIIEVFLEKLND